MLIQAPVLHRAREPQVVESIELEEPKQGEVLVKMAAGKLRIDDLITKRYSIHEANEAFRALAAGELARGLIVF